MPNFLLEEIPEINGSISIYKLNKDGACEFDEFWAEIFADGNLKKELAKIQYLMEAIVNLQLLPKTKYRKLNSESTDYPEFEIKTKHLRVYLFKVESTGKIIVCGGKKKSQKKDIKHFRKIKKEYISTIDP